MSLATNEKNLGLNASKTQPNYNTEWSKSLTLKAGANSFVPPYDFLYLKMAAQTFLICAPHQLHPAPPAKYSCWVSPHMHRLTASCCLWHTALHWHHLHLHAVENSPDKHCFCSFSHKAIAVGQQMPQSHLQMHAPTCTVPLLSRCLGTCLVGHTSSPQPAWANADTQKRQRQSQGRNTTPASQQKQSLPWPVPMEPELPLTPGFITSLEQDGTVLHHHSNVPWGLSNFS